MDKSIAVKFWQLLSKNWPHLYMQFILGKDSAYESLSTINSYLKELGGDIHEKIIIDASINEINNQELPAYNNTIELYISPKINKDNIALMESFYKNRIPLENCMVSKYRAYHPNDKLISNIDFQSFQISYDDIGYSGSVGYDEHKKPVLNIILVIKDTIAKHILEKKTVSFVNPIDNKKSSREIWMQTNHTPVEIFLINVIGEYNLLNHIGYIELFPSDDLMVVNNSFTELIDCKKQLDIVLKHRNLPECHYCQHNSLQTDLYNCARCKKVKYCGRKCQLADYATHKSICLEKVNDKS